MTPFASTAARRRATGLVLFLIGCNGGDVPVVYQPLPDAAPYPEAVHQPPQLTSVESGLPDGRGAPTRVACVTCHSLRPAGAMPGSPEALQAFHRGLVFRHGELTCTACHQGERGDELHLADGRPVAMTEAQALCKQCHGPQTRDYLHGSHGGMHGHWERRLGPRTRNTCVHCHDPHAPAWQPVQPAPPPRDRFLRATSAPHTP